MLDVGPDPLWARGSFSMFIGYHAVFHWISGGKRIQMFEKS